MIGRILPEQQFEFDLNMNDPTLQETLAIKESLSTILNDETITKFAETWDSIGLEQRHRVERRETMLQYIRDMLREMLAEEEALKKRMKDSIEKCLEDLNQLEAELKLENNDKVSLNK